MSAPAEKRLPPNSLPAALDEDTALARRAAAGEVRAFEQLYRRHAGRVHGVMLRLVGYQAARAEELTQEAFVRAWQKLDTFRGESAFGTWLHRLAVNVALMDLRVRADGEAREQALDEGWHELAAGAGCGAQRGELRLDLERAIATLPPRARAVLVLHDIEGWRHEEIGSELGIATGSSKAHLHRARQLMRRALGDEA